MNVINFLHSTAGPLNGNQGVCSFWNQRGSREDDDDENQPEIKKQRTSWYVTLQSESSSDDLANDDHESIYSLQEQETDYAQDLSHSPCSSHGLGHSDASRGSAESIWFDASNPNIIIEYDLATEPESEHLFLDTSNSGPDDIDIKKDLDFNHDSEPGPDDIDIKKDLDSNSDSEPNSEPSVVDEKGYVSDNYDTSDSIKSCTDSNASVGNKYYTCIQCLLTNDDPMYIYCTRCYQMRKNIFPPRPKNKKKRKDKSKSDAELSSQTSELTFRTDSGITDLTMSSQDLLSQNSLASCDNLQNSQGEIHNSEIHNSDENVKYLDINLISNDNETENKNKIVDDEIKNVDVDEHKCQACLVNIKDGAFNHGKIVHVCYCYKCAIRAWKTYKNCPLCKQKISNVAKVYYG